MGQIFRNEQHDAFGSWAMPATGRETEVRITEKCRTDPCSTGRVLDWLDVTIGAKIEPQPRDESAATRTTRGPAKI
jgi:hypothetical protein